MKDNCTNQSWAADTIMYQIFPDRFFNGDPSNDPEEKEIWGNAPTTTNFFGGDLKGILDKLDYLVDLGVDCLYLNPIFSAETNHRYDTVDYYEIDPMLGKTKDFHDFVNTLHHRGIKIILDGVFNHCSSQFPPFLDVVKNEKDSRYVNWFTVTDFPVREKPLNYAACGGCAYLPKFNHADQQVEDYLLAVGMHWLEEYGIDGWRLDTPQRVPKTFWKKFNRKMHEVSRDCYLIGELWRDAGAWINQDIFDGCTNYPLRELIISFFSERSLDAEDFSYELESLLSRLGPASFSMMNLLGCHDTPRIRTIFNGEDQDLLSAIVFQMTFIGIPLIYYGDEIGMTGRRDPDCRRTMEWDEDKWNGQIHSLYKELIQIRKEHPSLRRGSFQPLLTFDGLFAFKRQKDDEEIIVVLNPGSAVINIKVPVKSETTHWVSLIDSEREYQTTDGSLFFAEIGKNDWLLLRGNKSV
jgi:cyclomaltodextrinase